MNFRYAMSKWLFSILELKLIRVVKGTPGHRLQVDKFYQYTRPEIAAWAAKFSNSHQAITWT